MDAEDIQKEIFDSFNIDPQLLPDVKLDDEKFKAFRELLIRRIEELAERDMEKLMWILYRVDVNEKKLAQVLKQTAPEDFSKTIADMIIDRQIQKIQTRKQTDDKGNDWNFDI